MWTLVLLISSILIYASFGLKSVIFISFSALSTYLAARFMKKNKLVFYSTLIVNILILIFFKIISFDNIFNISILVPLGISYYTFTVLGYLIDVYKGKIRPEKNFFKYLLYVFYIPYLFIGPITRYDKIRDSLRLKRRLNINNFFNGLVKITWGLFKKFVVAGRISIIINTISSDTATYSGAYVLLALILYSLQLYYDFSGGIDCVIGVSEILNIKVGENFNTPYLSESIQEFWRRWHISVSSWFKDYIYIPLGGNRCSKLRNKINLIITFVVSGIWHGIHYTLWGLIHGLLVAFTPKKLTKFKPINVLITFLVVSMLWIFFIYPDTLTSLQMFGTIFTTFNYVDLFNNICNLGLNNINVIITIITIIILIISDIKLEDISNRVEKLKIDKKLIIILVLFTITLLFGIYGLGFEKNSFIYSRF